MRIVPMLLAAALALSASASFAASKSKDAKQMADSSTAAPSSSTADPQRKYCIELESVTGSRLYNRQCLTRAEWAKRGVDVDDQSKPY